MNTSAALLSKNGFIARQLALELIVFAEGDRLPTTQEFCQRLGAGAGTLVKAFHELEAAGAVRLRRRGHKGSYIIEKDLARLWDLADLDPIVGLMPLPNSGELQGLATGLTQTFWDADMPFRVIFAHGSRVRLQALESGKVDYVVMSELAAAAFEDRNEDLRRVATLQTGTYDTSDTGVVIAAPGVDRREAIRTVAIDPISYDHIQLSRAEFDDVQWIEALYHVIPRLVSQGVVDAAVWRKSSWGLSVADKPLQTFPLSKDKALDSVLSRSRAAILTLKGNPHLDQVFQTIPWHQVIDVQHRVIKGQMVPSF